jgi:hypothetical protein
MRIVNELNMRGTRRGEEREEEKRRELMEQHLSSCE